VVASLEQYNHDDLYIYAEHGPMRHNNNADGNGKSDDDANIYECCANLFGLGFGRFADIVDRRNYGNLVARFEQYRNDYLYIYADVGPMRDHHNNDDSRKRGSRVYDFGRLQRRELHFERRPKRRFERHL
jgi:hypothetical protein